MEQQTLAAEVAVVAFLVALTLHLELVDLG
jgi:hypothetical protein